MCLLSGLRGPWLRSEDAEPEARGVGKSPAIANRTGICLGMLPPRTQAVQKLPHLSFLAGHPSPNT